jgi:hypothetical protein
MLFIAALIALLTQQPTAHFPTVRSDNLEGKTFTLPADFAGERNVVFIAFEREQQKDVDTWVPFVGKQIAANPGTEYYELPTIKKMISLMKWTINKGMKSGIPDKGAREHTITLYIDKEPFKHDLAITDEKTIHVLIVDRAGNVLWRTSGVFTDDKAAALAAALRAH